MAVQKEVYPSITQAIGIQAMVFVFSMLIGFPKKAINLVVETSGEENPLVDSIMSFCFYTLVFGLTFVFAKRKVQLHGGRMPKLTFVGLSVGTFVVACIMVLSLGIIIDPLTHVIPSVNFFNSVLMREFKPELFSFATIVIVAPILEELIFRGIILNGFLKRYSPFYAILFSSLLFGIGHVNPSQIIVASLAGAFLGWVFYKTKSLLLCILLHFVNNCTSFIFMVVLNNPNGSLYQMFESNMANYSMVVLGASLVLGLGYWYFQKRYKQVIV
jgi:membrane protease YdiL (CAAX protease family)